MMTIKVPGFITKKKKKIPTFLTLLFTNELRFSKHVDPPSTILNMDVKEKG